MPTVQRGQRGASSSVQVPKRGRANSPRRGATPTTRLYTCCFVSNPRDQRFCDVEKLCRSTSPSRLDLGSGGAYKFRRGGLAKPLGAQFNVMFGTKANYLQHSFHFVSVLKKTATNMQKEEESPSRLSHSLGLPKLGVEIEDDLD